MIPNHQTSETAAQEALADIYCMTGTGVMPEILSYIRDRAAIALKALASQARTTTEQLKMDQNLSCSQARPAQPVAWQIFVTNNGIDVAVRKTEEEATSFAAQWADECNVRPLYTSPPDQSARIAELEAAVRDLAKEIAINAAIENSKSRAIEKHAAVIASCAVNPQPAEEQKP